MRGLGPFLLMVWTTGACSSAVGRSDPRSPAAPSAARSNAPQIKELCIGDADSCALTSDGKVWCWGDNRLHQQSERNDVQFERPRRADLPAADQIACGGAQTCVRTSAGEVSCLGVLPRVERVALAAPARDLALTDYGAGCALLVDGRVECWRPPSLPPIGPGALGIPVPAPRREPWQLTQAQAADGLVRRSPNVDTICVRKAGEIRCYGDLDSSERAREVAEPDRASALKPELATAVPANATSVAYGAWHACAATQGAILCWGAASLGQLGNGDVYLHATPVRVPGVGAATHLDASVEQACAATAEGVFCWGEFLDAQGGSLPEFTARSLPLAGPVLELSAATRGYVGTPEEHVKIPVRARTARGFWEFKAGWRKSKPRATGPLQRRERDVKAQSPDGLCGIDRVGSLVCLRRTYPGSNRTSLGQRLNFSGPEPFAQSSSLFGVANVDHVCGRTRSGRVSCFAADGRAEPRIRSAALDALHDIIALDAQDHGPLGLVCALDGEGSVLCWGDGTYGQLGPHAPNAPFEPRRIEGLPPTAEVAVGGAYACARTKTGEVYCWGSNREGQAPDGAKGSRETPVRVADLSERP